MGQQTSGGFLGPACPLSCFMQLGGATLPMAGGIGLAYLWASQSAVKGNGNAKLCSLPQMPLLPLLLHSTMGACNIELKW